MEFTLEAQKRNPKTKLSDIRGYTKEKKAELPGVVYGHKIDTQPLTLDYSTFLKLYRRAGRSNIITLVLNGKDIDVLVQEVQEDPVTGDFIHVDFHAIIATEKITTQVPIHLIGESPAVRLGLMVEQNMSEVEISCLPKDLISEIQVSIEGLENEGDVLHLSDIDINREKITFGIPEESGIASVHAPRAHKAETDDDAPADAGEGGEEGAEGEGEGAGEASEES